MGGETAEMPGLPETNTTLPAFPLVLWKKSSIIDNTKMRPGDAVIALPCSGVHSNGFSLVRRVFGIDSAAVGHL